MASLRQLERLPDSVLDTTSQPRKCREGQVRRCAHLGCSSGYDRCTKPDAFNGGGCVFEMEFTEELVVPLTQDILCHLHGTVLCCEHNKRTTSKTNDNESVYSAHIR